MGAGSDGWVGLQNTKRMERLNHAKHMGRNGLGRFCNAESQLRHWGWARISKVYVKGCKCCVVVVVVFQYIIMGGGNSKIF